MVKNLESSGVIYLSSDRVRIPRPIMDGYIAGNVPLWALELSAKLAARRSEEAFQARQRYRHRL